MEKYFLGFGGTAVVWLNVIILAFLWRALAAKFAASDSPKISAVGGAMGASL